MSDAKHGGLTGAYYGPAVPPPTRTSRSVGRGLGSCCCGCLFCALFQILVAVVIFVGVLALVLWLIFRPQMLKVHVEEATLAKFDLGNSSSSSLIYDLSLNVSIRNPNKRISIYYDYLDSEANYDGYRFGYDTSLPVFYQGHKNTTLIQPTFDGQQALAVTSVKDTYSREKDEGWFYVEVKIHTKVRYKFWIIKTNKYKPRFTCDLKLPAPSSGNTFSRTKCDVHL